MNQNQSDFEQYRDYDYSSLDYDDFSHLNIDPLEHLHYPARQGGREDHIDSLDYDEYAHLSINPLDYPSHQGGFDDLPRHAQGGIREQHSWNDSIGSVAKFVSLTGLALLLLKMGGPEQKVGTVDPEPIRPVQVDKQPHTEKAPPAPKAASPDLKPQKPLRDVLSAYNSFVKSNGGFISYDSMDCVTFLKNMATSQQGLGLVLTPTDIQRLLINFDELNNTEGYKQAIEKGDPRMKGVVHAFVSMGIGEEVKLKDLKGESGIGLFVQYHYAGRTKGHAAIVERINYDENRKPISMTILGSHGTTNGTGRLTVRFSKINDVFFVRLKGA